MREDIIGAPKCEFILYYKSAKILLVHPKCELIFVEQSAKILIVQQKCGLIFVLISNSSSDISL